MMDRPVSYRIVDNYRGESLVLNDTRVYMCNICGILVLDQELHTAWHKSLASIASDVYGVDPTDL